MTTTVPNPGFGVTADDLRAYDWQAELAGVSVRECCSFREIFTARGIITSKLESDDSQDERDLRWMLTHAEMAKIFEDGMPFDLRGLLVERFGLNLRNNIAHGLLPESQMITPGALYAWWLTLRLCCFPIAAARYEAPSCEPDNAASVPSVQPDQSLNR